MTANHPYAAWLRSLAGLVALAGVFVLSACGGGSGAPSQVLNQPAPVIPALTVFPAGPTIYSQVAATLTLTAAVVALLGLIGDYAQRIYRQSSGRPFYLVRRVHDASDVGATSRVG